MIARHIAALAGAALVTFTGCATAASPSSDDDGDVPAIEIAPALVDEIVPITAALIRARGENPPGLERRVVEELEPRLRQAGFDVDIKPFGNSETRANLRATLPGADRSAPPIVILGHSDVVPADPSEWTTAPWDGVVVGDRLVGRGAIDMLGMVTLEALALVALKDANVTLQRDVILLVTGDEEVDGLGILQALRDWPELKRADVVLTEGGYILESFLRPGEDLAAIAVAEKGVFQFRLHAQGPSGHGSTPLEGTAPDRVVRAAHRVLGRDITSAITAPVAANLSSLGAQRGGFEGFVLQNGALARLIAVPQLEATPTGAAVLRDTCSLTMLDAGLKPNIIPPSASATFDCRLLPGTSPQAFHDHMLVIVDDPRVRIDVLSARAASGSDPDHRLVRAMSVRLKREMPGVVVTPVLTKGASDCTHLREAGVKCYGFIPVRISGEELDSMHGKDERVRTEELQKGLSRLVDVVAALAGARPGGAAR